MQIMTSNNESVTIYLEKYLGKLTSDQTHQIEKLLGIRVIDDLLFLEEDMLLKNQDREYDFFSPIQKRKLITIAKYKKLSPSDDDSSWDINISLNAMYQCVNTHENDRATTTTTTPSKKFQRKNKSSETISLNKPKLDVDLDDNALFSRHLIVTKYKSYKEMEGKGYLLLFPPEWHKTAEETLKMWPSSWEVWQFCQLNTVDMSFPGPAKMVQEIGFLNIELDDEFVTDLWSLCTSTWKMNA